MRVLPIEKKQPRHGFGAVRRGANVKKGPFLFVFAAACCLLVPVRVARAGLGDWIVAAGPPVEADRKSTRLNSSHYS